MKKYRVNVNGTVYEVELEEITGAAPAASVAALAIFMALSSSCCWAAKGFSTAPGSFRGASAPVPSARPDSLVPAPSPARRGRRTIVSCVSG